MREWYDLYRELVLSDIYTDRDKLKERVASGKIWRMKWLVERKKRFNLIKKLNPSSKITLPHAKTFVNAGN